jgi:RNA polymerase sporulation-specific sigma factor
MYFRTLKKTAQDVSINDPIETDKDGNNLSLIDVIADDKNILDEIDLRIKTEKLQKYMKEVLTSRERLIVSLRFGLIGGKEKTQREIAKQLGISRSYVSRIEKKALIKLYEKFVSAPI